MDNEELLDEYELNVDLSDGKVFYYNDKLYKSFYKVIRNKHLIKLFILILYEIIFLSFVFFIIKTNVDVSDKLMMIIAIGGILASVFFFLILYHVMILATCNDSGLFKDRCYILKNNKLYLIKFDKEMTYSTKNTYDIYKDNKEVLINTGNIYLCEEITDTRIIKEYKDRYKIKCNIRNLNTNKTSFNDTIEIYKYYEHHEELLNFIP